MMSNIKYYQMPTYQWGTKQVRLPDRQLHTLLFARIMKVSSWPQNRYLVSCQRLTDLWRSQVHMTCTFSTFPPMSCDDDTLILHANSRRGLPQCCNNYTLFIFLLICSFSSRITVYQCPMCFANIWEGDFLVCDILAPILRHPWSNPPNRTPE